MLTMKLPIGISDFQKLRENNYLYIDKSLLVKEVIDDGSEVILITRPRRFGKTLNLSMLNHYFNLKNAEQSHGLFDGLAISEAGEEYSRYQGQYPVILVSFKSVKAANFDSARILIIALLSRLYRQYAYLLDSEIFIANERDVFTRMLNKEPSADELNDALLNLTDYLYRYHGEKVIVLIDEYDTPVHEAFIHDYHPPILNLLRGILGQVLKDNENLEKAVVTGILRITKANMFSDINNISSYSIFDDKFAGKFGFTSSDVQWVLEQRNGNGEHLRQATEWYNGYQISNVVLYNPWSIIKYVDGNFKPKSFWVGTGGDKLIRRLLTSSNLETKRQFQQLLQGQSVHKVINEFTIFQQLNDNPESIWGLLLFGGYLKVVSLEYIGTEARCELAIPNREVSFAYDDMIREYFSYSGMHSYQQFIQSLVDGDMEIFQARLQAYINESTSYFDLSQRTPEQVYHLFILGLVIGMRDNYFIESNRETGIGRCDVMMTPKDKNCPGIIIEFKTAETESDLQVTAAVALQQITDKQYVQKLQQQGINQVRQLGVAFHGKKVFVDGIE